MKLTLKAFIGLPVRSVSGLDIGRVSGAELDTETGRLQTIHAKAGGLVKGLMNDEALIDWSQIVEITDRFLIVEDAAVDKIRVKSSEAATETASATSVASVAMSSEG